MAAFCLTKQATENFLKGLKSGEIDPQKLSDMKSSEERHAFLEKYVGKENAKQVNALLESKLLLKNQQQGMITWAKKAGGLTEPARRDLISRIGRMDKYLNPKDAEQFMKDLASTKLGVDVTREEAKNIADLSKKVTEAKVSLETGGDRMNYGRAKVALGNYMNLLKEEAGKTSVIANLKNPVKVVSDIAGNAKAIKASLDDSALFRQGWKTLWTHPGIWTKNAAKSFADIVKTFGKKAVMDEVTADIISRPNYNRMVTAKLATATIEEAFPTTLPEKIPLFGRFYKASEVAYTAFLHRQRADIFDKYIEIAEKSGINVDDVKDLKPIGSLVNSLTGRGNLGPAERAANTFNNVFFSPRMVKSEIDTLGHVITGAGGSNFVRKQAAINLVKVIAGTAAILTIAKSVNPNSVETDPRSSDFGKIRIGDTRFDVTGGMASLATLAARLITMSSKSTTTGQVTPLNSGKYGSQTGADVAVNWLENKLSPAGSIVKDIMKGQDFNGHKVTIGNELNNLFTPLPITNYQELKSNPNAAPILVGLIADGLGISVNTFGVKKSDWNSNPGVKLLQFKAKVGDTRFQQANSQFNQQYAQWIEKTSKSNTYQNLSESAKQSLITKAKAAIETKVMKDNSFTYKKPILPSSKRKEQETIKRMIPK